MKPVLCELCNRQPHLYCTSDKAFLCFHCDATVHNANFIVARHLRRLLCSSCHSLSSHFFSGHPSPSLTSPLCQSCSPHSSSSSCVSTTETTKSTRFKNERVKSEGAFGNWCKKLGVNGNNVISRASYAMEEICVGKALLGYKVRLAASFWYGLRNTGNATRRNLKALEKLSGVPGKVIVAVELKVEHVLRVRGSRRDLQEGWAEC